MQISSSEVPELRPSAPYGVQKQGKDIQYMGHHLPGTAVSSFAGRGTCNGNAEGASYMRLSESGKALQATAGARGYGGILSSIVFSRFLGKVFSRHFPMVFPAVMQNRICRHAPILFTWRMHFPTVFSEPSLMKGQGRKGLSKTRRPGHVMRREKPPNYLQGPFNRLEYSNAMCPDLSAFHAGDSWPNILPVES